MNKAEALRFVNEIADEMQKQGDPRLFTESECARVLMAAKKECRFLYLIVSANLSGIIS